MTPNYIDNPQTFGGKFHNFVENYFDLTNASAIETALKVFSYATLVIPAIVLAIKTFLRCISCISIRKITIPDDILAVLNQAPQFHGYIIGAPGSGLEETKLGSAHIRPANLLFRALFGDGATTMPGSGNLFAFTRNPAAIQA